jgi:hypothetical protein
MWNFAKLKRNSNKITMKDETLDKGWEEVLNDSTITGHISGRHLILVGGKKDRKWDGGEYEENEYQYLDEWIKRSVVTNLLAEQKAEIIERVEKMPSASRDEVQNEKVICSDDVINIIKE